MALFFSVLKNYGIDFKSGSSAGRGSKLRTQDFLPDEKVLREDRERKLSTPCPSEPHTLLESHITIYVFCLGRLRIRKTKTSRVLKLKLDQQNEHLPITVLL